jgi:hypothetical protein
VKTDINILLVIVVVLAILLAASYQKRRSQEEWTRRQLEIERMKREDQRARQDRSK